ncbi:hypothetical protein OG21DRAFT_167576 [Imleria badia]|nr:hypothetical protein OG21DRAFT_167576 [Imleria badia]
MSILNDLIPIPICAGECQHAVRSRWVYECLLPDPGQSAPLNRSPSLQDFTLYPGHEMMYPCSSSEMPVLYPHDQICPYKYSSMKSLERFRDPDRTRRRSKRVSGDDRAAASCKLTAGSDAPGWVVRSLRAGRGQLTHRRVGGSFIDTTVVPIDGKQAWDRLTSRALVHLLFIIVKR